MVSTSWGFCLMAIHIGLHFGIVISMVKKIPFRNQWITIVIRVIGFLLAFYGFYAFISRQIGERMLLLMEYAFFDYDEPAIFFFADYVCILIFFAMVAYYLGKFLRKKKGE